MIGFFFSQDNGKMEEEGNMNIEVLEPMFSICKITNLTKINIQDSFFFLAKTNEEMSLVCPTESVPEGTIEQVNHYKGMRIQGTLDFSLVGIIADISSILTNQKISIFVVSTYNTDYIFIQEKQLYYAVKALGDEGYHILV